MQIQFKATNYEINPELEASATKKIEAVEKYAPKKGLDSARAYVELGKITEAHQTGRIWRAEINFDIDGATYRVEATEDTLENAIDKTVAELSRELRNAKDKQGSLMRRGGASVKTFLQGWGNRV